MSDPNNLMCALNHLPPDIVEAILPFLPPKSLGRFKSVSKRWYFLISSPNFIRTLTLNYTKNNPNPNPTHLILAPLYGKSFYSLDVKKLNAQITPATLTAKRPNLQRPYNWIQGSCNGLLLVYSMQNLRLVNPTTGKTLKIPLSSDRCNDAFGFGYDSSTDDYKVIIISNIRVPDSDPPRHFVNVYSLRNNSSSMLPICPYKQNDYHRQPGVLLNNTLHWVVRNGSETMTMVTFSLDNEEFHEIELPEFIKCSQDSFKRSQVFAFGGKLVVVFNEHYYSSFYELWVMKEYGVPKSWTNLCVFENNMDLAFELFAQISNRDIVLGINKANELIIYNMDERRCTSVAIQGYPRGFFSYNMYVESLESPERFG